MIEYAKFGWFESIIVENRDKTKPFKNSSDDWSPPRTAVVSIGCVYTPMSEKIVFFNCSFEEFQNHREDDDAITKRLLS